MIHSEKIVIIGSCYLLYIASEIIKKNEIDLPIRKAFHGGVMDGYES